MANEWKTVIRPRRPWWDIDLSSVLEYRYLAYLFTKRDFSVAFKQTVLGPLWYVIQPLFTSGIFTIIFGAIAKLPTDGIPQPLFYFAGVAFWSYLSVLMTQSAQIFQSQANMFNKVYFPRLIVPISFSASRFLQFGIQLVFMAVIYLAYVIGGASVHPTWAIVALPLVIGTGVAFSLGLGLWVSAWSVKYRDLTNLFSFGVGLLMYATPVIYPLSLVESKWKMLMYINPLTGIMELYRYCLFGQGTVTPELLVVSFGGAFVVLAIGVILFSRAEQTAMDIA